MQQIDTKILQEQIWLCVEGDILRIVQEVLIWAYDQMVWSQNSIRIGEQNAQTFWDFEIQTNHLIPTRLVGCLEFMAYQPF